MNKKWYVSSGDINVEVEADSPLEAAKMVVKNCRPNEDKLGTIMRVSDKAFERDHNPWYVATEVAIKAAGHKLEYAE